MDDIYEICDEAFKSFADDVREECVRSGAAPTVEFTKQALRKSVKIILTAVAGDDAVVEDHFNLQVLPDDGQQVQVELNPKTEIGQFIVAYLAGDVEVV